MAESESLYHTESEYSGWGPGMIICSDNSTDLPNIITFG